MKEKVADLAAAGGRPLFAKPLHVGLPNVGRSERLIERIKDIIERRWLTNHGPYVVEFERRIAELTGVRHCVATCNGTRALEIAVRACGLEGEIIVPSFTFIATAHSLKWVGLEPVFADIERETCTLDPDRIESLITQRTSGIMGVHLWGRPCRVEELAAIAERRGLTLLFDASQALGCSHGGRKIGSFGHAEVFSFHATKLVNTFEGGAIVTDDGELARRARLMTNFGFTGYDKVEYLGTNGKMSEPAAAMGLTSLEAMDEIVEINRRNLEAYVRAFERIRGIEVRQPEAREQSNYQYVASLVDESICGVGRDELYAILNAENVIVRRYFYPGCHRMEPYLTQDPEAGERLKVTEAVAAQCLCFPSGPGVDEAAIERIASLVRFVIENADEVKRIVRMGGLPEPLEPTLRIEEEEEQVDESTGVAGYQGQRSAEGGYSRF